MTEIEYNNLYNKIVKSGINQDVINEINSLPKKMELICKLQHIDYICHDGIDIDSLSDYTYSIYRIFAPVSVFFNSKNRWRGVRLICNKNKTNDLLKYILSKPKLSFQEERVIYVGLNTPIHYREKINSSLIEEVIKSGKGKYLRYSNFHFQNVNNYNQAEHITLLALKNDYKCLYKNVQFNFLCTTKNWLYYEQTWDGENIYEEWNLSNYLVDYPKDSPIDKSLIIKPSELSPFWRKALIDSLTINSSKLCVALKLWPEFESLILSKFKFSMNFPHHETPERVLLKYWSYFQYRGDMYSYSNRLRNKLLKSNRKCLYINQRTYSLIKPPEFNPKIAPHSAHVSLKCAESILNEKFIKYNIYIPEIINIILFMAC